MRDFRGLLGFMMINTCLSDMLRHQDVEHTCPGWVCWLKISRLRDTSSLDTNIDIFSVSAPPWSRWDHAWNTWLEANSPGDEFLFRCSNSEHTILNMRKYFSPEFKNICQLYQIRISLAIFPPPPKPSSTEGWCPWCWCSCRWSCPPWLSPRPSQAPACPGWSSQWWPSRQRHHRMMNPVLWEISKKYFMSYSKIISLQQPESREWGERRRGQWRGGLRGWARQREEHSRVQHNIDQPDQPTVLCEIILYLFNSVRVRDYLPVWNPSMKRPTYWTSIVISPNNKPADIAIHALLQSGNTCK